ncbi:MAG: hypothetical protein NT069_20385, partial [Planctomycetota bacterium]|nr:hypothetical protein [Planctomycetota bacterium]
MSDPVRFMKPFSVFAVTCGIMRSVTKKSDVAPLRCSAGREPSARVSTMEEDVFQPRHPKAEAGEDGLDDRRQER